MTPADRSLHPSSLLLIVRRGCRYRSLELPSRRIIGTAVVAAVCGSFAPQHRQPHTTTITTITTSDCTMSARRRWPFRALEHRTPLIHQVRGLCSISLLFISVVPCGQDIRRRLSFSANFFAFIYIRIYQYMFCIYSYIYKSLLFHPSCHASTSNHTTPVHHE